MNTTRKRGSQGLCLPSDYPDTRQPDCGVIAVAVAANVPYCKAWQTIRAVWDRSGRWKGRTDEHERSMALKRLKKSAPKPVSLPGGMTVRTFLALHATPDVWYWVQTGSHIATCMRDGSNSLEMFRVVDNIKDHTRFMRCRVKKVWQI